MVMISGKAGEQQADLYEVMLAGWNHPVPMSIMLDRQRSERRRRDRVGRMVCSLVAAAHAAALPALS